MAPLTNIDPSRHGGLALSRSSVPSARLAGFAASLPSLDISNGSLVALKWIALLLMTGDHINKYLFNETLPYLFELGRLAAPLFGFVLAYNLGRPGALKSEAYQRTTWRLLIAGVLSTPAFIGLGGLLGGVYPLNIMFMLFTATAAMLQLDRGKRVIALAIIVTGGALVEFWWPAVGFCVAVWAYRRSPSWRALILAVACCALLWIINRDFWAMAALPVIVAVALVNVRLPRLKWFFYAFYPLHLYVLWLVRVPMAKAGYLFF